MSAFSFPVDPPDDDAEDERREPKEIEKIDRHKNYSRRRELREEIDDAYRLVRQAFTDKNDQIEKCKNYRDIYACELNENQSYSGVHKIYMPCVHDAIEARNIRAVNTLFPPNGRVTEVTSASTEDRPYALQSLMDTYVDKANLRSLVSALVRSGDITGQYSLHYSWSETKRVTTKRVKKPVMVDGIPGPDEYETVNAEEVTEFGPDVTCVSTEDLAVVPANAASIDKADLVAIRVRYTKRGFKRLAKEQGFDKKLVKQVEETMGVKGDDPNGGSDQDKDRLADAGVKTEGKAKYLVLFIAWTQMEIEGVDQSVVMWFGGENCCLACKINPDWSGRVPILSCPLKQVEGSFWGLSPVKAVEEIQYAANDAVNMGMDSASYALNPIVMTDPEKNPRVASMVLNMAAIWQTNPADTKFVEFPPLWKDALSLVSALTSQVEKTLSTNPSMMPGGGSPTAKKSQAQVAQEQAVALESTADYVAVIKKGILDPLLERIFELDQQYRNADMMTAKYGELGREEELTKVAPQAFEGRYQFQWYGAEQQTKNNQDIQNKTSLLNVLKQVPPNALPGMQLDLSPIIVQIVEATFGPRMTPSILRKTEDTMSLPPDQENVLMLECFPMDVRASDNDQEHLMSHHQAVAQRGDPYGVFAVHMKKHEMQMTRKAQQQQAQAAQQQQQQQGGPRPGAQVVPPKGGQMPPGAVRSEQMSTPGNMPRQM